MPAANDRATLVAALEEQFDALLELGRDLTEEQWGTPSEVPGWTVKDNFSHVIGTELMLLGRPDETIDIGDVEHVKNDIGTFNEVPIRTRSGKSGQEVLAEFALVAGERKAALAAMSEADFDAESFTPAGKDTYGRFMQIRVFDCWIHEQDCREALGLPGHTSGAAVVDDLDDPTTTVTMPTTLWFRFAAGRRPGDPSHADVTIEGDQALGESVVTNPAYTI